MTTEETRVRGLQAIDRNRELLSRAECYAYKETEQGELRCYLFGPAEWSMADQRPMVLFFFSSMWDRGLVSQFAPQCLHFANRGMVAGAFEYRVANTHGTGPLDALEDARTAVRFMRYHAASFGVHPGRIIVGGGGAGAWMALCCATAEDVELNSAADDLEISARPDALVLFEPIVDVTRKGIGFERFPDVRTAKMLSPLRHVKKGLPPAVIMHGTHDRVVPFEPVRRLARLWKSKRNEVAFHPYEGAAHSFYNFNVNLRLYELSLGNVDDFLTRLFFLPPTDEFSDGSG